MTEYMIVPFEIYSWGLPCRVRHHELGSVPVVRVDVGKYDTYFSSTWDCIGIIASTSNISMNKLRGRPFRRQNQFLDLRWHLLMAREIGLDS